ncbi:hypothetical protein [Acetobacter orientalis]|uniref:hypothetical protein n=1 Tax=Acetobacter orientalis TaxID=146474 RepID=UPI0039EB3EDF
MVNGLFDDAPLMQQGPVNLSRRRFMLTSAGAAAGAFVLGFGLPARQARAQAAKGPKYRGTQVPAFLEIRPDNTVRLQSPFIEGGQSIRQGVRKRDTLSR